MKADTFAAAAEALQVPEVRRIEDVNHLAAYQTRSVESSLKLTLTFTSESG